VLGESEGNQNIAQDSWLSSYDSQFYYVSLQCYYKNLAGIAIPSNIFETDMTSNMKQHEIIPFSDTV